MPRIDYNPKDVNAQVRKTHFEDEKGRTLCGIKIIHNTAIAFDPYEVTCIRCGDILETTVKGNIRRMKKIDKMMKGMYSNRRRNCDTPKKNICNR